jgi:hypothetical protein
LKGATQHIKHSRLVSPRRSNGCFRLVLLARAYPRFADRHIITGGLEKLSLRKALPSLPSPRRFVVFLLSSPFHSSSVLRRDLPVSSSILYYYSYFHRSRYSASSLPPLSPPPPPCPLTNAKPKPGALPRATAPCQATQAPPQAAGSRTTQLRERDTEQDEDGACHRDSRRRSCWWDTSVRPSIALQGQQGMRSAMWC